MPVLPFTTHAAARGFGLPPIKLENLYVEASEGPSSVVRLPRPGLLLSYQIGTGPIRGMFQQAGAFGGDKFAASGSQIYREQIVLGTVLGADNARFAASGTEVVVVSGGAVYRSDGVTLARITIPDDDEVVDVAYFGGRFVYIIAGSGKFRWSAINNASSIDGLDYATAEGAPDATVAVLVLAGELYFIGQTTTEIWQATTNIDAPFQRVSERSIDKGCPAQATVVSRLDNTAFFLGSDRQVYRLGAGATRVSTHAMEALIETCTDLASATAFQARFAGHAIYVLNLPGVGSPALDVATGEWSMWSSYRRDAFRARCGLITETTDYFGDDENGSVYRLGGNTDDGEPLTRLASAFAAVPFGVGRGDSLMLQGQRGVGNAAAPDPMVEMRFSDDLGSLWSDWMAASMGKQGEYGVKARWGNLGMMESPGRLFEIRTTDAVSMSYQQLVINEPRA